MPFGRSRNDIFFDGERPSDALMALQMRSDLPTFLLLLAGHFSMMRDKFLTYLRIICLNRVR